MTANMTIVRWRIYLVESLLTVLLLIMLFEGVSWGQANILFSSRKTKDWGSIQIKRVGVDYDIVLENEYLFIRYGKHGTPPKKVSDRIVEFRLKDPNVTISENLDGRHTAGKDKSFYRITEAIVEHNEARRKTLKLVFGNGIRVEHLSLYKGLPFLEIAYEDTSRDYGHVLHYADLGNDYLIYSAKAWQKIKGWPKTYPVLHENISDRNSYYRGEWGATPLDYSGYIIAGSFSDEKGKGLGLLLPTAKIRFLKLQPKGGGFEAAVKGSYSAYLYPVTSVDQIVLNGKKWVDLISTQEIKHQ